MTDKIRVLIVEDEPIVAEDIKNRLELLGYEVAGLAKSADKAVALAGRERPEIVLMDIRLEGQTDGIEAADQIRKRWDLPVIFLTAYSEDSAISRAKLAEPFGYILKPFEDRELKTTIEMAVYKHKVDRALRASKDFAENLIESLVDGLSVINKEGTRIMVNTALCRMTGFTKDELLSKPYEMKWPPEHMKEMREAFETMMKGNLKEMELILMRKNGERFSGMLIPSYMRDQSGKITNIIVIIRDITERKRAEEALAESEERYRTIVEYSNDMIWTLDMDGNFLFFNKHAEELSGYRLEDLKGKSYSSVIVKEDLPKLVEVFQQTLKGKPRNYESSFTAKNGKIISIEANTAPIFIKGEIAGTVTFGRDISDRKNAERALIKLNSELEKRVKDRTVELEKKNAELEQLNRFFVGRELRMTELKKQIVELEKQISDMKNTTGAK